ncbi:MAG: oligosaccharide flippase family protein [Pseudonocardiaceae bacterium]
MSASPSMVTASADAGRLRGPVVASLAGKAAEALTLLLLATVIPRVLGPADYGAFAVALTVVAIGSVTMTLGGATLLTRYVPAAVPGERGALARALSVRLARNRAVLFAVLTVIATALVMWDPARFPPLLTAFVLIALALNVGATLALQADLGLGRAGAWCARYPVQNAVLVVAAIELYGAAGVTGAVAAIVVSAAAGFGLGVLAVTPLLRRRDQPVLVPDGALRFGLFQAASGALVQVAQRGGIIAVALLAGSSVQTGFAALAIGVALAATYAIGQVFTVSLPRLAQRHGESAESSLRRLASGLLAVVVPVAAVTVLVIDTAVPIVFGEGYAGAAAAFAPALAMVVLAPVNALVVQSAALRLQPEATLYAAVAGVLSFAGAAVLAVPVWGAAGATGAAFAGAAGYALLAIRLLPGAADVRLTAASLGGASAVILLGVIT